MTKGSIRNFDNSNMFENLLRFSNQIRNACKIGESLDIKTLPKGKNILITGMGGSAIAGHLLVNYTNNLIDCEHLNIQINRQYDIPKYYKNDLLGIVSSYSGNTEETISAFRNIEKTTNKIIVISTGGKLAKLANSTNKTLIEIPSGLQPREAIGYSFFVQLYIMMLSGSFKATATQITANAVNELLKVIDRNRMIFKKENPENPSFAFAQELKGKIPIIYSSQKYEAIKLRFTGQFQENAKIPSFGSIIPEMNHNEINFLSNKENAKNFHFILIKDDDENNRILKRFEFLEDKFNELDLSFSVIKPSSKNLLSRYFELIYYADWTSYWLALLLGKDPTEIPVINDLKSFLSK